MLIGTNRMVLQTDCNLVMYSDTGAAVWATGTDKYGANCYLDMADDGHLKLFNANNIVLWSKP